MMNEIGENNLLFALYKNFNIPSISAFSMIPPLKNISTFSMIPPLKKLSISVKMTNKEDLFDLRWRYSGLNFKNPAPYRPRK